ncbi:MAG TPA: hypothetical protein VHF24_05970 [Acidimicrobiales bacterium]|nr:hypothetical protein [Acidimicrobiales bacterium]
MGGSPTSSAKPTANAERDSATSRASESTVQGRAGCWWNMVLAGEVALPAGEVREPFVDADDIAAVAAAALTEPGHEGQLYEVTGPRLLTFADAVEEISSATGREIRYVQLAPDAFTDALRAEAVPDGYVWLLDYLFATVLDGRNQYVTDGVARALGREPRDFGDYARAAAATGVWAPGADRVA